MSTTPNEGEKPIRPDQPDAPGPPQDPDAAPLDPDVNPDYEDDKP